MASDEYEAAVQEGLIDQATARRLRDIKERDDRRKAERPRFQLHLTHVFWVGGAALVVVGWLLLAEQVFEDSPEPLAFALFAACLVCIWSATRVRKNNGDEVAAICLSVAAICLFAGTISALQQANGTLNYFQPIAPPDGQPMRPDLRPMYDRLQETAAAPGFVLILFSLPLLVWRRFLPAWGLIALGTWVFAMEYARLSGPPETTGGDVLQVVSLWFGAVVLLMSYFSDLGATHNHGYWLNKAGWMATSAGMGAYYADDIGAAKEIFLIVCIVSCFLSVFLRRPGGLPFAALGIFTYLVEHFLELLPNIWWTAACLNLLGLVLISIGLRIAKRINRSSTATKEGFVRLRPERRDDPVTFGF